MPRTRPARPAATVADLQERPGGVPADRVWADPPPGTGTEADVWPTWRGARVPDRDQ